MSDEWVNVGWMDADDVEGLHDRLHEVATDFAKLTSAEMTVEGDLDLALGGLRITVGEPLPAARVRQEVIIRTEVADLVRVEKLTAVVYPLGDLGFQLYDIQDRKTSYHLKEN